MPINSCDDAAGSLNSPNGSPEQLGTNNPDLKPYSAPSYKIGELEISNLSLDACARADQARQETYVAESLNISGAPINVFKLLGVHEQGAALTANSLNIITSTAYPGFPRTGINTGSSWKSLSQGQAVVDNQSYVGADLASFRLIGAVQLTQSNNPNEYARQVKVEIADGKCKPSAAIFSGDDGRITNIFAGVESIESTLNIIAINTTQFEVYSTSSSGTQLLGIAAVGIPFNSMRVSFTILSKLVGSYAVGESFTFTLSYEWKRVGIFNLIQSPNPQALNLTSQFKIKAIRIIPTLYTGTSNWTVSNLEVFENSITNINNIQDLFFNENRDRDYAKVPVLIKVQYSPTDSVSDLSRFGLNILDQYSFTTAFSSMALALGRPLVVGDIIEVIPEMQYDQNLNPVRKFLEVTDTGWAGEGFSAFWKPTVFRFSAQQALPSQETRDIFGTIDTQKYMVADPILASNIGAQIDITPLSQTEQIKVEAVDKVPETGSDDRAAMIGVELPPTLPAVNHKGQPQPDTHHGKQGIYVEDGLPPSGIPYGEGYKLPEATTVDDGDYFRLNYPPETKIPPRLYRFSTIKNRWIYQETDRRGQYSSHKPSVRSILESDTKQGLGKKTS